jgi:hypothetical protein
VTAERIRDLICIALREHPEFRDAKPTRCLYADRVALAAEEQPDDDGRPGRLWRVHIVREAL